MQSYLLIFLILGAALGGFVFLHWTRGGMGPLEQIYFRQYAKATAKSWMFPDGRGKYLLLIGEHGGRPIGVTDELVYPIRDPQGRGLRDQYGWIFRPYSITGIDQPRWKYVRMLDRAMEGWFRENIYGGESLPGLFVPALLTCLVTMVAGTALAIVVDRLSNRKYEEGSRVRGSRLIEPGEYEREVDDADGLGLTVKSLKPRTGLKGLAWKLMGGGEPVWTLRMKRSEEAQGMLILGDIGSGKSQILHRYLQQLRERKNEAVVVYDPACEFVRTHYNPRRGDVILNPLDTRSPFWSLTFEIKYRTDNQVLAEIFFPGRKAEKMHQTESFFLNASRDIFARLLEFEPDPRTLIAWLSDEREIDRKVEGTELAHYIDPKAAPQRGGVLGSLSKVGKTLRLLPARKECEFDFSLTQWAEKRQGWIFLTGTKEAEEQLRPLYAAYLDLMMRRLMSVDERWGRQHPCWLIVDEVNSLEYLPTLAKAITEARKFGVPLIQGAQNKHQYDDNYGQAAPTMLSCPRHTIILRCKEPESAQWLSKLIGEEELEKPRSGVTASVSDQGRDSINYSSQTERRAVVSREEIANLSDLTGYWKYEDKVVPFRFDFLPWTKVAEGFIPRQSLAPVKSQVKDQSLETVPVEAAPVGKKEPEETQGGSQIVPWYKGQSGTRSMDRFHD
ncbi:MAG TPA: type IV secretion system DNA-binding domain-containing protein [Blastocatellia bacterium]|nr:type IV secretion system DNA-binding domain-containing protein [Blastocatellia bacterium]